MNSLSSELSHAHIFVNNISQNTIAASNWAESDSIVGMICSGRPCLTDAMRNGNGYWFGISHLNETLSYLVASRINSPNDDAPGIVTVKFDATEMARYLAGRHITLIVGHRGHITTLPVQFMQHNLAPPLPRGITRLGGVMTKMIRKNLLIYEQSLAKAVPSGGLLMAAPICCSVSLCSTPDSSCSRLLHWRSWNPCAGSTSG